MKQKSSQIIIQSRTRIAGFLLALCSVIAINIVVNNLHIRIDLTKEKVYTLSEGTKNIISKLSTPVTLKFFCNSSTPEIPPQIKNYATKVLDLLQEYKINSGGKIKIEKYDPKPDSESEELAHRYGITGQTLGGPGGINLYLGIVAVRGDAEACIPLIDPAQDELLEYNITKIISQVIQTRKPVIGVISSLPVTGEMSPMAVLNRKMQAPWIFIQSLKQRFSIRPIPLESKTIDPDITALLIIHPKDISDQLLFAIDQFLLKGGKICVLVDAQNIAERIVTPEFNMQERFQPKSSNMEKLFLAWGVKFTDSKVVADLEAPTRLAGPSGPQLNPVWLSLNSKNINANVPVVAKLNNLLFPLAGTLSLTNVPPECIVTKLIETSSSSALIDAMMASFGPDAIRREFKSEGKKFCIALMLTGKFHTAFPEGRPKSDEKDKESLHVADEAILKESKDPGTVIIIGDSDFIFDDFSVRKIPFFNIEIPQPINENLALIENIFDYFSGNIELAMVRTRAKLSKPFEKIIELQRKASEKYLEEEQSLEEKLDRAQRRLNELEAKKDPSQRMILSPEQKAEIENARMEVLQAKKRLRYVRYKLREDIENLGMIIKAINILGMPILISIAGIIVVVIKKLR